MGKADKLVYKWRNNVPSEVRKEDVFLVLEYYGFVHVDKSGGSHMQFYHEALKSRPDLYPLGEITVIVKNGRYVKKWYIKDLLQAIDVVEACD